MGLAQQLRTFCPTQPFPKITMTSPTITAPPATTAIVSRPDRVSRPHPPPTARAFRSQQLWPKGFSLAWLHKQISPSPPAPGLMEGYPDWVDLPADQHMVCQFPGCCKQFKAYQWLAQHVRRAHEVPTAELRNHWIHEMSIHERNPKQVSADEKDHVELKWQGDGNVDEEQAWELGAPHPE